jgi:hypothetical protein
MRALLSWGTLSRIALGRLRRLCYSSSYNNTRISRFCSTRSSRGKTDLNALLLTRHGRSIDVVLGTGGRAGIKYRATIACDRSTGTNSDRGMASGIITRELCDGRCGCSLDL